MAMMFLDTLWDKIENLSLWVTKIDLIPASVFAAVVLFLIKEALEILKKSSSRKREIAALKLLLARECELNFYVCNQIEYICTQFKPFEDSELRCPYMFSIIDMPTKKMRYEISTIVNGEKIDGGIVPEVHTSSMTKYLYEIAKIDNNFYKVLLPAYDSSIELNHLRDTLIDEPVTKNIVGGDEFIVGYSSYALDEIEDIKIKLSNLFKFCRGTELIKGRLR